MELMERYVYAVLQRLPEQQREEIRKELYGLIQDMLEEQFGTTEPAEEQVESVLLQLGPPAGMAAKYRGQERYLIGPALYEPYWTTLKIVAAAILLSLSVIFAIEVILEPGTLLDKFVEYLASLFSALAQGAVWVTAAFAFVEYRGRREGNREDPGKKWRPRELPPIPDPQTRIKLSEPIAGIIFTILFTVLILFGPELLGVYRFHEGSRAIIPFLNAEVIGRYLPLAAILGVLGVLKETCKIVIRRRTVFLFGLQVAFNLLSLVFVVILLSAPGFWNPEFLAQLQAAGLAPQGGEDYESVRTLWLTVTNNLIYLIAILTFIDIASEGYKWLRARKPAPPLFNSNL